MPLWVTVFLVLAVLHAAAGTGGGLSYLALMTLAGWPHAEAAVIALALNLVATCAGSWNWLRGGHLRADLAGFLLVGAVPAVWLASRVPWSQEVFLWVLLGFTVIAAARSLMKEAKPPREWNPASRAVVCVALGAAVGVAAGVAGLGGGIFLIPALVLLRIATVKQAAASGALVIAVSSLLGIFGKLEAYGGSLAPVWEKLVWLVPAVLVGGWVGSHWGSKVLPPRRVQQTLGMVLAMAAVVIVMRLVRG